MTAVDPAAEDARVERLREESRLAMIARQQTAPMRRPLAPAMAEARLDYAEKAASRALDLLRLALEDMALARVLELSRAYPRRMVEFCSAMGSTTLEVERRGGWSGQDAHKLDHDPLMKAFEATCDAYGFGHLPVRYIKAKGGEIVANLCDW